MSKLWVYGCSFSTDYTKRATSTDGKTWYEHLAEKFNLQIENHALDGHGIVSVVSMILKTINNWDKNDLVMIELPDPLRIDIPSIDDSTNIYAINEDKGRMVGLMDEYIKDVGTEYIEDNTISIWNGLTGLLKTHENKNIYTWFIHYKDGSNHLKSLYDGSVMDWINENTTYISEEDKHFSHEGAEKFYNYILPKIKYNG